MRRRRGLLPLVLLAAVVSARAAGCKGKSASPKSAPRATIAAPHWVTPLMTPPPPRPTVTMWVGATRVPQLPE